MYVLHICEIHAVCVLGILRTKSRNSFKITFMKFTKEIIKYNDGSTFLSTTSAAGIVVVGASGAISSCSDGPSRDWPGV